MKKLDEQNHLISYRETRNNKLGKLKPYIKPEISRRDLLTEGLILAGSLRKVNGHLYLNGDEKGGNPNPFGETFITPQGTLTPTFGGTQHPDNIEWFDE